MQRVRQGNSESQRDGNMKRRLLIAAVFLLAGAVVNVAVAWGCAYRHGLVMTVLNDRVTVADPDRFWRDRRPPEWERGLLITVNRHRGLGRTRTVATGLVSSRARGNVPDWSTGEGYNGTEGVDAHQAHIIETRFGWPMRSLRWTYLGGDSYSYRSPTVNISNHELPLLTTWPGFAVNTLFYATFLWLPICGPFVLRRHLRIRRGLCPKCKYPMGESAVCTECGTQAPNQAR